MKELLTVSFHLHAYNNTAASIRIPLLNLCVVRLISSNIPFLADNNNKSPKLENSLCKGQVHPKSPACHLVKPGSLYIQLMKIMDQRTVEKATIIQ